MTPPLRTSQRLLTTFKIKSMLPDPATADFSRLISNTLPIILFPSTAGTKCLLGDRAVQGVWDTKWKNIYALVELLFY